MSDTSHRRSSSSLNVFLKRKKSFDGYRCFKHLIEWNICARHKTEFNGETFAIDSNDDTINEFSLFIFQHDKDNDKIENKQMKTRETRLLFSYLCREISQFCDIESWDHLRQSARCDNRIRNFIQTIRSFSHFFNANREKMTFFSSRLSCHRC